MPPKPVVGLHTSEMKTTEFIEEKRASYLDYIFRVACLFHGLQTGYKPRIWLTRFLWMTWLVILISFLGTLPLNYQLETAVFEGHMSLSELTTSGHELLQCATVLCTVLLVLWEHDNIEPLLQKHERPPQKIVFPLVSILPSLLELGFRAKLLNQWFEVYTRIRSLFTNFTMGIFFMIYVDMMSNFVKNQERILRNIATGRPNTKSVAAEKWKIRHQIKTVNSVFAMSLSAHYLLVFMTVVSSFAQIIRHKPDLEDAIFMICALLVNLLQLLVLAHESSVLKRQSIDIECFLLRQIKAEDTSRNSLYTDLLAVLRFREEWDVLQVGCFTHDVANFLKFLATVITCVAVVLQFDYKVVRKITTLSSIDS